MNLEYVLQKALEIDNLLAIGFLVAITFLCWGACQFIPKTKK